MKKCFLPLGVAILASALFCYPSSAIPLVDQPLDPTGYGFTSIYGGQNILENFSISSKSEITAISWYGLFSSGVLATDQSQANFDVLLFNNNDKAETTTSGGIPVSGLPLYEPFFQTTASSVKGSATAFSDPLHGGTIFRWETDIPQLSLDAGEYWIALRSSSTEPSFFLWSHSANEDGYAVQGILPAAFIPPYDPKISFWTVSDEAYDEQAFALYGTAVSAAKPVPEPTTVLLLGLGLIGIGGYANKRYL